MSDPSSTVFGWPAPPSPGGSIPQASSSASRAVELLPDPVISAMPRPLAIVGPHTYAAIWPLVRHESEPKSIGRELVFVRDDGLLCLSQGASQRNLHASQSTGDPLSASSEPLFAETSLPLDHAPLPLDRFLSDRGLKRYLGGQRPDPGVLFGR